MKTDTRLIFGVRTSGAVSLTVTTNGPLPQQPPVLWIKTSAQDIEIPCSNNTWVAPLSAGDHIAYMPAPGDRWFDAPLTLTLSAPATIINPPDTTKVLRAWAAAAGTVGTYDSKNPWPPPLDGNTDLASLANSTWLSSTLTAMMPEVSIARSDPADAPPAGTGEPRRPRGS